LDYYANLENYIRKESLLYWFRYFDFIMVLSNQKVDEVNGQGSQGKIDAPKGVSILLKTDANA
jgi:hypothetical protein